MATCAMAFCIYISHVTHLKPHNKNMYAISRTIKPAPDR